MQEYNQFNRVISLIGEGNYKKIKNTTILVVGVGGVGGYVVEGLIRSGIEKIILIDHDKIDITNLNRQIITNKDNIGLSKVLEFKKRIESINENVDVETLEIFLDENNMHILDNYQIDYIVDCCDTVKTKEKLIDYSVERNIKLISSMGTAKKIDPSKLVITDIRKTSYDPLAKIIRKYVRDKKIKEKITVLSSEEKIIERSTLASMIFVPAVGGLLISNHIIRDIIGDIN